MGVERSGFRISPTQNDEYRNHKTHAGGSLLADLRTAVQGLEVGFPDFTHKLNSLFVRSEDRPDETDLV